MDLVISITFFCAKHIHSASQVHFFFLWLFFFGLCFGATARIEELIESLKSLTKEVVTIEATNLAIEAGNVVSTNVVMLGGLLASGRFPLPMEDIKASIIDIIPASKHEMNMKAFEFGAKAVKEKSKNPGLRTLK